MVFTILLGVEEITLLSCWNFWNSRSKSMFSPRDPRGEAVDGETLPVGVAEYCFVYSVEGLGVTATCKS